LSESKPLSARHGKAWAAFALLFLGITAFLVAGGLYVRSVVSAAFRDADGIRNARAHVNDMLRHQLDEETGVRGYAATRLPIFLQPYYSGRRDLALDFGRVRAELTSLKVAEALPVLRDAATTNARWLHQVAMPLIGTPGRHVAINSEERG
jgi:CHASE3 domain sensor protein